MPPDLGTPPVLPYISLPDAPDLRTPTLSIPTAEIPSYKVLVVPPSDLERPKGTAEEESAEKEPAPPPPVPTIPTVSYTHLRAPEPDS